VAEPTRLSASAVRSGRPAGNFGSAHPLRISEYSYHDTFDLDGWAFRFFQCKVSLGEADGGQARANKTDGVDEGGIEDRHVGGCKCCSMCLLGYESVLFESDECVVEKYVGI
jgi:hypothetical protein